MKQHREALLKKKAPCKTLLELGTLAERHNTRISHALLNAVANAVVDGSRYGWESA